MMQISRSLATLVAAMSAVALGDVQTFCPNGATNVCYSVGVPSSSAKAGSGNVYFQLRAPTSYAWVAMGTSTTMATSNMFLMYQDGNGNVTVSPRTTTQHNPPTLDTSANAPSLTLLAGSGVTTDGFMIANVACSNCNSLSKGTLSLTNTASPWLCAWQSGASLATTSTQARISQHDQYDFFGIDLTKATIASDANPFVASSGNGGTGTGTGGSGTGTGSGTGSSTGGGVAAIGGKRPSEAILMAHGIIMAVVFVLMYPIFSMLMPLLGKWQVHAGLQSVSFILMWVGFGMGVSAAKERSMLFDNIHTIMGTVVVCLLFVQPFLGYAHHMYYVKYQKRGVISYVHIFWGQSLIVLGLVNGGLGLELTGARTSIVVAYAVVASVVFTVYAVVKVFTLFKASRAKNLPRGGNKEAQSPPSGRTPPRSYAPSPQIHAANHNNGYDSRRRPYP